MNLSQISSPFPSSPENVPLQTTQGLNPHRDLETDAADFAAAMASGAGPAQSLTQETMKSITDKAVEDIGKANNPADAIGIMDNAMKELNASVTQAIASDPNASIVLIPAQAEAQIAMMSAYFAKFPAA